MKIDHDAFVAWANEKFDDVIVSGTEVKINDPWWTNDEGLGDSDHKCWVNTEKACFRAFKSEETGHLLHFVMKVEGCSWQDATDIVGGEESLYSLENRLLAFLSNEKTEFIEKPVIPKELELPESTYLIDALPDDVPLKKFAANYLKDRSINTKGLLVCLDGRYRNRIVIPYYDRNGNLIYFNTRALSKKEKIRYLGPSQKEFGVGKGDVLWMAKWPEDGAKVYLTEGEFDAMSLYQCGLSAAACGGKTLTAKQKALLSPYRIAFAFDADKAGKEMFKIAEDLMAEGKAMMNGKPRITFVRPPQEFKDWNKTYAITQSDTAIRQYIEMYEKPCTEDNLMKMQFGDL